MLQGHQRFLFMIIFYKQNSFSLSSLVCDGGNAETSIEKKAKKRRRLSRFIRVYFFSSIFLVTQEFEERGL